MKIKFGEKGLTLTSQQLRFVGGILLAIIILFCIWWFVFQGRYERINSQSWGELAWAVNDTCANGQPHNVVVRMPQAQGLQGWLYEHSAGLAGGPNLGKDPYFYIFYEKFPPDPPPWWETQVIIAPWSEDTPWSTNALMTATMGVAMFGLEMGFGSIKPGIKAGQTMTQGMWNEFLMNHENVKKVVDFSKNTYKIFKKYGGTTIVREAKYFTAATMFGMGMCKAMTDWSVGDCFRTVVTGYVIARVGYKGVQKLRSSYIENMKELGFKTTLNSLRTAGEGAADTADETLEQAYNDDLISRGVGEYSTEHFDSTTGKPLFEIHKSEDWEALEVAWEEQGRPGRMGDYTFVEEQGTLEKILKAPSNGYKKLTRSMNEKLNKMINKIVNKDVVGPDGLETFANHIDQVADTDIRRLQDISIEWKKTGQSIPFDPTDQDATRVWWKERASSLRKTAQDGGVMIIEKDTGYSEILTTSSDRVTYVDELNTYTKDLADRGSKYSKIDNEYRNFYYAVTERQLGIKETAREMTKGSLGYAILRYQDFYTPLGATYWDMKMSSYYISIGQCPPNHLCYLSGANVGRVIGANLSACVENGVKNVNLQRDSLIAKNPRFYLVSPCFSCVDIYRSGDTVYIKPGLCRNLPEEFERMPNYCYAAESVVNYYWTSEQASFWAQIGADIGCPFAGPFVLVCKGIVQALVLVNDYTRENIVTYPYTYNNLAPPVCGGGC